MVLTIVRHGETTSNSQDVLQGQLPGELNDKGWLQAKALALALKDEHFDAIFTTDIKRGLDTTELIAAHHSVPFVLEPLLRERHFGVHQGESRSKFYALERSLPDSTAHRPKLGESFLDLAKRVKKFAVRILGEYAEATVLVVSHGDVNRMLLGALQDLPVEDACKIPQANGCINQVRLVQGATREVLKLNFVDHLEAESRSSNLTDL